MDLESSPGPKNPEYSQKDGVHLVLHMFMCIIVSKQKSRGQENTLLYRRTQK